VRNLVERFFNKIKQCRRIATRYDRIAANYLAFIKLASIRTWLRAYESAPYVNDAVLMLPGLQDYFYRNNHGTGSLTVERLGN
jgi:hypothetical protein